MARILLIDDDDGLREVLKLVLTHAGHEVTDAGNGKAGLAALPSAKPDLVLCDIVMPEKEGLETIFEARRKHGIKRIIAMSGGGRMTPAEYLKTAQQMGASRVLMKPFMNQDLLKTVAEVLALP